MSQNDWLRKHQNIIITGETGAGKSILLGALKLILGERAQSGSLRAGAKKAVVEGVFSLSRSNPIYQIVESEGFDPSDVLILRREIRANQSRAFINDSPASLSQMRLIASELLDLHGQHEHQSLLKAGRHLSMIDDLGDYQETLSEYQSAFSELKRVRAELADLKKKERD